MMRISTGGFAGVPEAVWNFHIGGYRSREKWLKDRKGRTLSKDDIAHGSTVFDPEAQTRRDLAEVYQKIVVALNETIRLMKESDPSAGSGRARSTAAGRGRS